jgi:hypothetical protein
MKWAFIAALLAFMLLGPAHADNASQLRQRYLDEQLAIERAARLRFFPPACGGAASGFDVRIQQLLSQRASLVREAELSAIYGDSAQVSAIVEKVQQLDAALCDAYNAFGR